MPSLVGFSFKQPLSQLADLLWAGHLHLSPGQLPSPLPGLPLSPLPSYSLHSSGKDLLGIQI